MLKEFSQYNAFLFHFRKASGFPTCKKTKLNVWNWLNNQKVLCDSTALFVPFQSFTGRQKNVDFYLHDLKREWKEVKYLVFNEFSLEIDGYVWDHPKLDGVTGRLGKGGWRPPVR